MNILVCFKNVPDLDALSVNDWLIEDHFQVDTSYVRTMLNPYDESALELTLKLGDAEKNDDFKLTALTVGTSHLDKVLKTLYALKYDLGVRLDCKSDIRFNPCFVSRMICNYVKNIKNHQVIILGSQSNVGDNAKTPLLVAEGLGIPCITSVIGIKLAEQKDCLSITSKIDDLIIEQIVKAPFVLAVGDVPTSYIRVPTLKDRIQYKEKEIKVFTLEDLEIKENDVEEENDTQLIELSYEKNGRNCVFIQGHHSSEKANVLYKEYLMERIK
ncbi:MAG: hypothetical protein CVV02_03565 [Firmicutes bacterium HGW-Firmicutes-7]|nr:MAG: hypothetical protein CVV02_03565 [Firmicutes bacterium HGW-Firmicutes-7]